MKKTISINLNRQVFNLDTDAYSSLEEYLSNIKKHFDKTDSSEIIDDIESRIAEKFTEILGKTKKVIQSEDVHQVIKEMGSITDITGDDNSDETTETEKTFSGRKKLFRDVDNKVIAGIASGFAWYFNLPSILIRIIFLVLLFNKSTNWMTLIAYFACWLIIPKAENNFEKLEMKGLPTTISKLKNASTQTNNISNFEKKTQNFFQKIFSLFFRLIKFFLKWSLKLTGLLFFIGNIILIVCLVVGLVLIYFNQFISYIDLNFLKSISSPALEIGFISFGIFLIMPLVFCLDLSDDLMKLKWTISSKRVLSIILIWLISITTFSFTAKFTYPQYEGQLNAFSEKMNYVRDIDRTNQQIIKIDQIKSIDISSVREFKLVQSDENVLIISGKQHQIQQLETQISSNNIHIQGQSGSFSNICSGCITYVSSVRVEIRSPNISAIKLDNTNSKIETTSGNYQINLVKKTGLKIVGTLNNLSLISGPKSVANLLESNINQVDAQLDQSTLKSGAKIIKIKGDSQSVLIYKNQSQVISQKGDESQKEEYRD